MTHVRRLARLAASRLGRRASQRQQLRRRLRTEQLESRNMMAADWLVSDFWNGTRPEDVNADGQVAPLDALLVINQLNGYGSRTVMGPNASLPVGSEGETSAAGNKPLYYDVNNDGEISPIDALLVINDLNGEGEGEVVQYQVQVMQPGTNTPLTTVAKGQEFDLRVTVRDGRVGGRGVFAGYLDILVNNTALARPRASEVQHIVIDSTATGFDVTAGTFTVTFNGQTSSPIAFSNESDPADVAPLIQQELAAMAGIGTDNVRVIYDPIFATNEVEGEPFRWQVRFVNNLFDTDVAPITGAYTANPGTAAATLVVDQTAAGNINDPAAFREAFRSQVIPGVTNTVYYVNALNAGNLPDRIDDVGAFATGGAPFPGTQLVELVRARMIATDGGVLTFDPDLTDILSAAHDTLLYDRDDPVLASEIILSNPVSITITEPITADDESVTMAEDTLASNPITNINVLAGDTTTLPGTLRVRSVNTTGITGTVTFTATGVKYVPAPNFSGTETFTYTVGIGASGGPTDTASVTVTVTPVNDAPANNVPGTQNISEDVAHVFSAANGNAITIADIDAGTSNVQVTLTATNGTLTMGSTTNLTVAGNGSGVVTVTGLIADINIGLNGLTFNPTANFAGNASINVQTSDLGNTGAGSALTDTDNIAIVVGAVNDAPVNSVPGPQSVDEMTTLVFSGGNGNAITVSDIDAGAGQISVTVSVPASAGLLSVGGNPGAASLVLTGTVTSINTQLDGLTFTPTDGFTGLTTLTILTNDQGNTGSGGELSDTDSVEIDVVAVVRPRARPDTFNRSEGAGPFSLDVMSNDLGNLIPGDPEGDEFPTTLEAVGTASFGTVVINNNGTAADKTDDFLDYTPPSADFFGTVTFTYSIWDTSSAVPGTIPDHATATVTLIVGNVNDAPVAQDDSYSTAEDTPLTVNAPGVLGNDSDVDNNFGGPADPQTAIIVANPAHGTVTLNANGSFTYTPTGNYSGPDSFTYKVRDGQNAESNVATVSITVTPVNDAPVAVNDSFNATEDTTLNVALPGVLGNDTDIDSANLTAEIVAQAANGTVTLNADGSFSYVPVGNYSGPDSFTYQVRDDQNAVSNVATVTLTVAPINDPPVAANDSYIATEDTTLNVPARGVLINDTDIDSATLTAVLVSGPASGSLTLNPNGSFSYTPALDFVGQVSFSYRASDGPSLSNIATVTIDVQEVNDPPTALADSYSTNEDQQLVVPAIGVLGNDNDPETGTAALTAHLVSAMPASQGTVALSTTGSFTFTPAANFFGTTSFTYRASDGVNNSAPVTVTITVSEVNDAPTATNDSVVAIKDIANQIISVLGNDSILPDVGETLSVVAVNGGTGPVATAAGGTVELVGGQIRYTPAAGFTGNDSFEYTISDNRAVNPLTATATVNINVIAFVPKVISGTVYIDADGDGQVDAGESRVQNAEVRLSGTDFLGASVNLVAFTDINGRYEFRGSGPQLLGLAPGSYTITEVQPRYLGDGQDTEASPLAVRTANDTFQVGWNEFDFSGHITGLNFGETGINASSLADSSGLIQEILASSGPNGFVLTTSLSGNMVWSWSMPGWSNMQSCQIELDANLSSATMRVTDKAGNLHIIRIHQSPTENTESYYPSGSMARFRILGRSATNEYIIRIDGTAADFGLNLLAAAPAAAEGEGDNREFAEAADELFAEEAWA